MRRLAAAVLLTVAALATPAPACDLCSPPPPEFATIQAELAAASTVVLGDLAGTDMRGRPQFVIRELLRGGEQLVPGQSVSIEDAVPGDGVYLLFGENSGLDARRPRRIEQDVADFAVLVARAPVHVPEEPAAWGKWLAQMVPFLSSENMLIASSAGQEFSDAPYAAVRAVKGRVDADDLLSALTAPETPVRSRGALALLTGICGTDAHVKQLEGLLTEERFRAATGFDAILTAYLMLRGPDGLTKVREILATRLADGDARTGVNVLAALRFLAQIETVLSREQILTELHALLASDALAPAVILELATLQDWDSLPLVMAAYRRLRERGPMVLGPVARFVKECPLPDAEAARVEVMGKPREGE